MRKSIPYFISFIFGLAAIITLLTLMLLMLKQNIRLSKSTIILFLVATSLFSYISLRLIHKQYYIWHVLLIIYILVLGYLLFFSKEFARSHITFSTFDNYIDSLKSQWNASVNLYPFATIHNMLRVWNSSWYGNYSFTNLVGNFVAFLPFSIFAHMFVPKMKTLTFFVYMSLLIISIEILQFLTFRGSMDIDDYLLNIAGAMLGFMLCAIPKVKRFLLKMKNIGRSID